MDAGALQLGLREDLSSAVAAGMGVAMQQMHHFPLLMFANDVPSFGPVDLVDMKAPLAAGTSVTIPWAYLMSSSC